jgi:DNA topoisomerase III
MQAPKNLSDAEQKIYDLVARRFLAVFFPAAEYLVSTRITEVSGYSFKTEGRVLVNPGWLAIYGREQQTDDDQIVSVKPGELALTQLIELVKLVTKPPARYSEATLLSAMEGAGKLMEEDELREAMVGKGLGTPATRSTIIEGLINENYVIRDGRELIPTAKAFQLLTLLRGLGVQELTKPELTGEWEYKLSLIEQGKLERDTFMGEIAAMAQQIVERAKNYGSTTVPGDYSTLTAPCPKCGKVVKENYKRFACTECDFSISKTPGSRQFEVPEVEQLLREKTLGPLQGFRSKMGRPFAAILKITGEHKLEFDFGQGQAGEDGEQEAVDFTGKSAVGPCPKCGHQVFEHGLSYVCEKSVSVPKSCDFRSGKIILQQEIEATQMQKLLVEGRTDLLQNFVSSRTRRKFKAFLVKGAEGKIGFEFQARPVKPGDEGKPAKAYVPKPAAAASGKAAKGKSATGKFVKGKPSTIKVAGSSSSDGGRDESAVAMPLKVAATNKAPAKKPSAKKAVAKKPAAKKAAAKKPAAKKVATKK